MKRKHSFFIVALLLLVSCQGQTIATENSSTSDTSSSLITANEESSFTNTQEENSTMESKEYQMRIRFNDTELIATMYDNPTSLAIRDMLPMELYMSDLYSREMCYRFIDALPVENPSTQSYEVGEIVYYPPMHSFVIMYAQNGERFQMEKLGYISSGVEVFATTGSLTVSFELI